MKNKARNKKKMNYKSFATTKHESMRVVLEMYDAPVKRPSLPNSLNIKLQSSSVTSLPRALKDKEK